MCGCVCMYVGGRIGGWAGMYRCTYECVYMYIVYITLAQGGASLQICDMDNDGLLNDQELNDFQVQRHAV